MQLKLKVASMDAAALEQARQLLAADHLAARLHTQLKETHSQGLTGGRESAFTIPLIAQDMSCT